jgi:hypothetical protein
MIALASALFWIATSPLAHLDRSDSSSASASGGSLQCHATNPG